MLHRYGPAFLIEFPALPIEVPVAGRCIILDDRCCRSVPHRKYPVLYSRTTVHDDSETQVALCCKGEE